MRLDVCLGLNNSNLSSSDIEGKILVCKPVLSIHHITSHFKPDFRPKTSNLKLFFSIFFCVIVSAQSQAQTIGGETVFSFLKLSPAPQTAALGGINLSNDNRDVGLTFSNPSLLNVKHHQQLQVSYNSFLAGINNYFLQGAWHVQKWETTFAMGIHYLHYGSINQTDASGNELGTFKPSDYVLQASASRTYGSRFQYGATIKWIQSNYGTFRSAGVALDIAGLYKDTSALLQASLVLKNMGVQYKAYTGTEPGDLPFDIQAGISKRLKHAPLQLSLTLHHLHHFDIRYADTVFNETENDQSFFFDKLFRHVVLATQVYIGEHVEVSAGYNHLRRSELNIGNGGNGLNGFSAGVGVLFRKFQFRYSKAWYQTQKGFNQVGMNVEFGNN